MKPADYLPTSLSIAEYHQLEQESGIRYEYHNGEVFAMAGGEPKHNAISANVHRVLGNLLLDRNCNVFSSDQRYWINARNKALYPDASVTCGEVERAESDSQALINPLLLVEVLSKTTEGYDRGDKLKYYSTLPSLREYLLVEQLQPSVQIYYRDSPSRLWKMSWVEGLESSLTLQSLDITILLQDLYIKTENL
ncbi:MAG: Uma2 family endonuclease [Bacteroidota bacterium]